MNFAKTVGAYLTGWLIVHPIYTRLYAWWRRREMAKPDGEYRTHLRAQAEEFVDEMERRGHLIRPASPSIPPRGSERW